MISDSLVPAAQDDRWRKAFRITIQKCILGTVIAATGTRAIYFTVQVRAECRGGIKLFMDENFIILISLL